MIKTIVSMTKDRTIGLEGELPWHIRKDLKYFFKKTKNHYLIVGRNTYESMTDKIRERKDSYELGYGRTPVILTSDPDYKPREEEAVILTSKEAVLDFCQGKECFIIGGASIYEQFLNHSEKMYITWVDIDIVGDRFFPEINWSDWILESSKKSKKDSRLTYEIFSRK